MMILAVNLAGLIVIGLIVWWFWLSKPRAKQASSNRIDILVDNGVYTPARIEVRAGEPLVLRFLRKDASPCAEKVIFASMDISRDLSLNENTDIELPPLSAGEYEFTCQMQMYRGSLVAR